MSDQVRKRDILYNRITNLASKLESINAFKDESIGAISAQKSVLESDWAKLSELNDQLSASAATDGERKAHDDLYAKALGFYLIAMGHLDDLIQKSDVSQRASNTTIIEADGPSMGLRFAPLRLSNFDGTHANWIAFKNQYITLVHTNKKLSDAVKFSQLISHLENRALKVIKGIEPTGTNYGRAWQTLLNRYDQPQMLINSHLKKFFEITPMKVGEPNTKLLEIVDSTNELINSMPGLGETMQSWDSILIFCLFNKLDEGTRTAWENSSSHSEKPELTKFLQFLDKRAQYNDVTTSGLLSENKNRHTDAKAKNKGKSVMHASAKKCGACGDGHPLYHCPTFKSKKVKERIQIADKEKLCKVCLNPLHKKDEKCKFSECTVCGKKHNRLLCYEEEKMRNNPIKELDSDSSEAPVVNHAYLKDVKIPLLGTALIQFPESRVDNRMARALVDNGSHINLMTESTARRLVIPRVKTNVPLNGVGGENAGFAKGIAYLDVADRFGNFAFNDRFFIVPKITINLPLEKPSERHLKVFQRLQLADPTFAIPGEIDVLLGISAWTRVLEPGLQLSQARQCVAQKTILGWIVQGEMPKATDTSSISLVSATLVKEPDSVLQSLEQFWKSEDDPILKRARTSLENKCERHFQATHYRTSSGRYGVRLPFNEKLPSLGPSKASALRQFASLERRLKTNPELKDKYDQFMNEYIELGHMTICDEDESVDDGYYTPHHPVFTSNKFRTVFNASNPTKSGISLNEAQLVGEKLQDDLTITLLKFRRHRVALTADVSKMYRQIEVHPEDRKYQKILWRESSDQPIRVYELNTVTYGQAAAPYCAVRAMQQCAHDYSDEYPLGAQTVLKCFYMDDCLTGGDDEYEVLKIQSEMDTLMQKGGFSLAKYCSNSPAICEELSIPIMPNSMELGTPETRTVLGLCWSPATDEFHFKINAIEDESVWTKRKILSRIGQLYDPTGFLAPCTILAKIFIQQLWKEQLDWDEALPEALVKEWQSYIYDLPFLQEIRIPRWLGMRSMAKSSLHGFCDASLRAYGAAVYVRTVMPNGVIACRLIQAKTRVAPMSEASIPRLELCAAVLLAKLTAIISEAFGEQIGQTTYWSDSQVVLRWLNKSPDHWNIYVANRVSAIQSICSADRWRYIPSALNPADFASRGLRADVLNDSVLWWRGPPFLSNSMELWPEFNTVPSESCDRLVQSAQRKTKSQVMPVHVLFPEYPALMRGPWFKHENRENNPARANLLDAYGNFDKLINTKVQVNRAREHFMFKAGKSQSAPNYGIPTDLERQSALSDVLFMEQARCMSNEILAIKNDRPELKSKAFRNVVLFISEHDGLIRLRGRLTNAELSYDRKYPVVLPYESVIAERILAKAHLVTLHGGVQQMLIYVRTHIWINKARQLARRVIHNCPACYRQNMKVGQQLMAELPTKRTTPGRAFSCCGVDYCGPVSLKVWSGRSKITIKGYISVFVCLVTRAVHLELVSDMTTEAFIAALRRFVARRGHITEMISDNGTNFVGANRYLKQIASLHGSTRESAAFRGMQINWTFATPGAPHHGGLYEAAVKSAKKHLVRVIGEQRLTFEEYATVLAQVEACLNSRPICPISDDPRDLIPLTPGHFLIGEPIIGLPESRDLVEVPDNRLRRWELLQKMQQSFWKRWHEEYISTLINRPKWNTVHRDFKLNDLCLLKEDNLPPCRWKLGRVVKVFPGPDGHVRSVELQTATGIYKRPITKVGLIPVSENEPEPRPRALTPDSGESSEGDSIRAEYARASSSTSSAPEAANYQLGSGDEFTEST